MLHRQAERTFKDLAASFPVVTITGPRQSGKTTLVRMVFPEKAYLSLETPHQRQYAGDDPLGFLAQFPDGVILDEIQRAPGLLSYIQTLVDENPRPGRYILTGSNQFEYMRSINQSLAGRTGILKLLPFACSELPRERTVDNDQLLFSGFYPAIFDRNIRPDLFHAAYLATYLERDVRNISKIHNLSLFQNFLQLCAGRTGQILNKNSLANECGISAKTVEEWLSVLEASYIIYRLKPYYKNWNKRIVKSPKLYFLDVGLAAHLLKIEQVAHLHAHPLRGELFETCIIGECLKYRYNQGKRDNFYYFRDNNGNEVDLVMDTHFGPVPIEIKSGRTINDVFFKGLRFFAGLQRGYHRAGLVTGQDGVETRSDFLVHGPATVHRLLEALESDANRREAEREPR
jgi:hypothetical protein